MKQTVFNMKVMGRDFNRATMIYIGRPYADASPAKMEQHFGNPFSSIHTATPTIKVNSREEAVENFELWIRGKAFKNVEPSRRQWILDNLDLLKDKHLGCWCAPRLCHGEIYIKLLKEKRDGNKKSKAKSDRNDHASRKHTSRAHQ